MPNVGLLFGIEETFPSALCDRINELGKKSKVSAEFCAIDIWNMDEKKHYDVVLDRISQDVPFYRAVLKNMVLSGTKVINNPFRMDADEKFFSYSVCAKAGMCIPKTVLIPSKNNPAGTTEKTFRNLKFPLSLDETFNHIGFPAYFKPHAGGGWKNIYKVNSPEEFFDAYAKTGEMAMMLQENIDYEEYYRCYCIGKEEMRIMPYEPRNPPHERYQASFTPNEKLLKQMEKDCMTICETLGYDFNMTEFAVKNGIPYAIDFTNSAPDAEKTLVGDENFEWLLNASAEFLIECARDSARKKRSAKKSVNWREMILG
jgi:hypothetical protein